MNIRDPALPGDAFSLVRNDLLFRVQRRFGLIPAEGLGLVRRALFWSLLAWGPIALWAWSAGRAMGEELNEPLLAHFGVHVRFLVAVPLSLRLEMGAFVALAVAIFAASLLAFAGCLKRARKQALLDYGALVGRHGRQVRERWIEGKQLEDDALLSAPELGPVADTQAVYDAVKAMHTVPLGRSSILSLALAAAAPMLVVIAMEVPLKTILLGIVKALL